MVTSHIERPVKVVDPDAGELHPQAPQLRVLIGGAALEDAGVELNGRVIKQRLHDSANYRPTETTEGGW